MHVSVLIKLLQAYKGINQKTAGPKYVKDQQAQLPGEPHLYRPLCPATSTPGRTVQCTVYTDAHRWQVTNCSATFSWEVAAEPALPAAPGLGGTFPSCSPALVRGREEQSTLCIPWPLLFAPPACPQILVLNTSFFENTQSSSYFPDGMLCKPLMTKSLSTCRYCPPCLTPPLTHSATTK